jgi:hypothetical protein
MDFVAIRQQLRRRQSEVVNTQAASLDPSPRLRGGAKGLSADKLRPAILGIQGLPRTGGRNLRLSQPVATRFKLWTTERLSGPLILTRNTHAMAVGQRTSSSRWQTKNVQGDTGRIIETEFFSPPWLRMTFAAAIAFGATIGAARPDHDDTEKLACSLARLGQTTAARPSVCMTIRRIRMVPGCPDT